MSKLYWKVIKIWRCYYKDGRQAGFYLEKESALAKKWESDNNGVIQLEDLTVPT